MTINDKAAALLDYLKTKPTKMWTTQEEIIFMLPEYFKAKKTSTATTLDRAIYSAMQLINQSGEILVINNGKRAYKVATKEEAVQYAKSLINKHAKGMKRAWNVLKVIKLDNSYDLLDENFKQIFRLETSHNNEETSN